LNLPLTKFLEEWRVTAVAHPVVDQVFNTPAGQTGSGKRIHLVLLVRCIVIDTTLDQADPRLALVLVIELLANPLLFLAGLVNFAAQTRSLCVGVEAQTLDGVQVTFQ